MNRIISNQLCLAAGAGLIALAAAGAAVAMPSFGDWSAPANIEAMPGSSTSMSTPAIDGCASQSRDGLTIFFNSNRGGTHDIYMATRTSKSDGFGDPVKLLAPVNSSATEFCPTITPGKHLYFSSTRDDSFGDLYVTKLRPNGWSEPERLGSNINSSQMDEAAAFYEDDDGNEVMLFCRRHPNGTAGKIYQSVNGGPATLVQGGPHSSASDCRPSVSHDGRTIFFDSTRSGGLGGPDLYYATRSNTSEAWGTAIHLQSLSSPAFDARPSVSWDGDLLTFSSGRTGGDGAIDIWFATR